MVDMVPDGLPPGMEKAGLIGIAVAAVYKIWRVLKSDRREDGAAAMADQIRGELKADNDKLRAEIARIAGERNAAVQRLGRAIADRDHARQERDDLRALLKLPPRPPDPPDPPDTFTTQPEGAGHSAGPSVSGDGA